MKCKKPGCNGVMQRTAEIGTMITMRCGVCGWTINRHPDDSLSKSMRRARRQAEKAAQPKTDSLTEEYIRCQRAREEIQRKKEARRKVERRRLHAVKAGRYSVPNFKPNPEEGWEEKVSDDDG